ncbi:MAG: hypothetical protein U5J62_02315 [Desulfurivibrio sp.]|nr:hypothetical protein [Desulfurivibrio sp.]
MKQTFLIAALMSLLAPPITAFAHGTDYRVIEKDQVVAAEFFYSDMTPMRYTEVLVFSPENDKVEFQNGRTDANGRFAFFAHLPGDWKIEVNDGMGHAVHAAIAVSPETQEANSAGDNSGLEKKKAHSTVTKKNHALLGDASTVVKLFLGLSAMINLFLGMYVWKRKK